MAKMARPAPVPAESVDADRVLAFINTLSGRPTPAPVERLDTYPALVEWAREQHLVSAAAAERLAGEAASILTRPLPCWRAPRIFAKRSMAWQRRSIAGGNRTPTC